MKKFWKPLLFAAIGVFALSSCEDVPAPYEIPGGGTTPVDPKEVVEPTGSGTIEEPYNVAAANEVASALQQSNTSETFLSDEVYVKGIISQIDDAFNPQFGNMTYYISDDGSQTGQLEIYRGFYLDGAKFTSAGQIAVGDTVIVCGKLQNWLGKVNEFTSGSKLVYHNGSGSTEPVEGIDVTCAEAVELTSALEDGGTSAEVYSVTGYITEVVGEVSKNQQTFWMADEKTGGKVFEAYWANLPAGVEAFKVGMKVKITGNLMKYVNKDGKMTPEIKNATVEILEDGGDTPTPAGTEVTCAQAVDLTNALEDGATSAETYSVTGYITEVLGAVSTKTGTPQQSFWMADTKDGGKVFEAYYANVPSGVSEFKAGMKVKITGNLMKYVKDGKVTPEIKNATVEILEGGSDDGGSGGGGDTPEGDVTIAASGMGLTNNTSWTTVTVNGVTFTADGGGNQNTPKYFDNGSNLRMYPKNSLTISAGKNIASIVLTCTSGSVANGNVGAEPGSVSVSDPTITISGINSKTVKISNNDSSTGAASQIRIESIAIKFAE